MSDPNPIGTGPTKWRADHCTTHHHACDCREWEHACRIEQLEVALEDAKGRAAENLQRAADAEAYAEKLEEALRSATTMLRVPYPATAMRLRAVIATAQENDACHHINTVRGEDGVRWCQHCRQQLGQEDVDVQDA